MVFQYMFFHDLLMFIIIPGWPVLCMPPTGLHLLCPDSVSARGYEAPVHRFTVEELCEKTLTTIYPTKCNDSCRNACDTPLLEGISELPQAN